MLPEPLGITLKVTTVLEKLGVQYVIGGSLASTLYGVIRTTQDSDIVAKMQAEHIRPFVKALDNEFFIDELMIAEAVRHNSSFNIIHRESMFKVDVFVPRPRAFNESQFARAKNESISEESPVHARFSTAEDTILSKLEWYRVGGEASERQWRDVLGILKVQAGRLDLEYLHHWSKELKVDDLLERALQEA